MTKQKSKPLSYLESMGFTNPMYQITGKDGKPVGRVFVTGTHPLPERGAERFRDLWLRSPLPVMIKPYFDERPADLDSFVPAHFQAPEKE